MGYTRHRMKTNKTKTVQRNWQHGVHKAQDEDKQNKNSPEKTGNIGYTRHRMKTNKTKTVQRNWQHGVHKTKKNKAKTIQRNW